MLFSLVVPPTHPSGKRANNYCRFWPDGPTQLFEAVRPPGSSMATPVFMGAKSCEKSSIFGTFCSRAFFVKKHTKEGFLAKIRRRIEQRKRKHTWDEFIRGRNKQGEVVVVVVFTLKTIPVSLSSTSFCPSFSVLIQHLTRPISVVTGWRIH